MTSPSSWATTVPGRGVAHAAASQVFDLVLACGSHHLRDIGAQARADDRQQRLDAALYEARFIGDELDALGVQLVGQDLEQLGRKLGAWWQRHPDPPQWLAQAQAGL
jgi:hypothetical protein